MNNRQMIKSMTALLAVVVALIGAVPALANPPDRVMIPIEGSFTLAECDGFDVIDEYSGWVTLTDFYDQNGDLVRSTYHGSTHDRIYNSVTGFDDFSNFAYNQTIYPATDEYFIRGLAYNLTIPGYGIVFFDSGLGIFLYVDDEFVEVKFSGNYQTDSAELCEAMDQ